MNENISISVVSPITGKDLTNGSLPNEWNTLHENIRNGGKYVIPYCQKFDKGDIVTVPISSKSNATMTMTLYSGAVLIETIIGTLENSIVGDAGTIYHFCFDITFDSAYYDKEIDIFVEQGTDVLTFEPVLIEDLSEAIAEGRMKKIEYTNYNRTDTDVFGFFVDWGTLTSNADKTLFFYVESQNGSINDSDESEVLEGSQNKTIISASLFSGCLLSIDVIPLYMVRRLEAVTLLDFFAVNGIEYVKDGAVEAEQAGSSTSLQATINLTEKNIKGLNVNTLEFNEIENTDDMVQIEKLTDQTSDFSVAVPDGYMLHAIFVRHSATSSGSNATFSAGSTVSGQEYVSQYVGAITGTKSHNFPIHDNPENGEYVYCGIGGIGVKLDVTIQFILNS
jgi:ribosomal protein L21E